MSFIPHTEDDVREMLSTIGTKSVEDLFDEIPASLRYKGLDNIPEAQNEMLMLQGAQALSEKNRNGICFVGAGCYEHHIPSCVWDIASRGEFLTSYTPYQAEASQGTLQLLYEFQSMMCELTGLDVSNASLYDGASALAEAVLMAVRLNKNSKTNRVLVAGGLHPFYRETIETVVRNQNIELLTLPINFEKGISELDALKSYSGQDITALVVAQPNFFGCRESVDELTNWAHENKTISIACVNPISLALLTPPGLWGDFGVDIACGEGQPLGIPMASGGPYFGFLTARKQHVRQMPGRIVGLTVDKSGKRGFALTLQAREQHIRRAKATSNICTNQGLLVTAATIHMSVLGPQGLREVALQCHHNTHELVTLLSQIDGVSLVFKTPFFHEALLKINKPVDLVLDQLAQVGILGGYALESYPNLTNTLLVCATEMRTPEEIQTYAHALAAIMSA